ncbi:MAG: periplasmic heavy metal sensor [Chitinophagaceae bacterium]|nr:periplasmic heavy metal sensor [Chitinophagaceae bacterium]
MNRATFLTALVLLLIAVNSVTLYLLFKKDGSRDRRPTPAMFFKKLGLDQQQEQQFEELRKSHFQKRDSLRGEDMRLRKAMADMITNGVKDSAAIDSITNLLAANRKQFETNFYYHFQQMHSLLRPEQQQKLGEVLESILKRQGPPPGTKQGSPHP